MLQGCRLEGHAAAQEQTFAVRSRCAHIRGIKRITTYIWRLHVKTVRNIHLLRVEVLAFCKQRESNQGLWTRDFYLVSAIHLWEAPKCTDTQPESLTGRNTGTNRICLLGLWWMLRKIEASRRRRSNLHHLVQLVLPLPAGPAWLSAMWSVHLLLRWV